LLAKLTNKWIFFVELSGYRSETVHKLHERYGPVVQLGPSELSFSNMQAVNDIYGVGTRCIKAPSYEFYGRLGMFQTRDPEKHRERQKKVAHIFSQSSLAQAEPLIQDLIVTVVSIIAANVNKSFNALHWCRMTALDVSGI
jgi:cytochrome P450